ncbi:hypothetical protein ASC64_21325 [Nocardioides sp. Root122]|uniref:hypothetical protein n=1 Tax=Nocardioides TaxID=1839 RepID=UPI000702637C|nr:MULTISPECIES: hypothetical protein [Nocardioides]KQV71705.1 hypothetical protein ASC64_21325 [Nocardioides sp. Root122]MCK9825736.1 hypothetical protein [Nocardioides cavernae]
MNTRRTRSVLAVPVLVLALAGLSACGSDDSDQVAADTSESTAATTSESTSEATSDAEPVELVADASTAGKCAVPSAETLGTFDTAFAGTVTSLEDGTATLAVDQWYAGGDAATVTVTTPEKDLAALLMAVEFEKGKSYLVSATDGRVTLCGFTGETTPELQALYDEAFAG